MILGRTGSGKSFLLNFLITNLKKLRPLHLHLRSWGELRNSHALLAGLTCGLGLESSDFTINPFCLPTKPNLNFLALFLKVLIGRTLGTLDPQPIAIVYEQIENVFSLEPALRTLDALANTLPRPVSYAFAKWMRGGQFGFLFDNPQDTISFSRFQCFDFQQMSRYPELLEPLLFYILHRANDVISNRDISSTFKAFFIDEAWVSATPHYAHRGPRDIAKTRCRHDLAAVAPTN